MSRGSNAGAPTRVQALFDSYYESRASYRGDEDVKKDAASAKRVATSLRKATKEFERLLEPEQAQTLRAAAGIMAALGVDLDSVGTLARRCQIVTAAEDLQRRHAAADAVALARWQGDDAAMLAEARELADFVDQADATEAERWVCAQHPGCTLAGYPTDYLPNGQRLFDMLAMADGSALQRHQLRRRAAEYIAMFEREQKEPKRRYREVWRVGLDDYEAWRAWRRDVLKAITPPAIR